jgi:glyoxylase-like metal-dependent hydrolase (beta-lactamase superfamily II)
MKIDRRQFLMSGLAARLALAQKPAAPVLADKGFASVSKIADGVYATIADPAKGPQALSNGGILVGRSAVLIIEGHMSPEAASLEIETARMLSKAPILGAVDTHFHLDHSFGNSAYASQKIPILAHEQCTALMKKFYGDLKGKAAASLLRPAEQKLAAAAAGSDKQHAQSDVDATKWECDAIESTTLVYPTELLRVKDLPKKIDLGGLTAVIEFHLGHTPTDLIIRVPERDVVFAGDLLFYRKYPVSIDADMRAQRKVLDLFASYGRNVRFVPGHGPVCGLDTVREQMDLFDDLRAHAEKMKQAGAGAEEAERRYTAPARFKDFEIFAWGWTIGAALRSYYRA